LKEMKNWKADSQSAKEQETVCFNSISTWSLCLKG
jgi:hypothetical protein